MKKMLIVGAILAGVTLIGPNAWADTEKTVSQEDYRVFRKVVRILDDVLNYDYRRGTKVVVYKNHYRPRKVCYTPRHHHRGRGHYKQVCRVYR